MKWTVASAMRRVGPNKEYVDDVLKPCGSHGDAFVLASELELIARRVRKVLMLEHRNPTPQKPSRVVRARRLRLRRRHLCAPTGGARRCGASARQGRHRPEMSSGGAEQLPTQGQHRMMFDNSVACMRVCRAHFALELQPRRLFQLGRGLHRLACPA